MAYHRRWMTDDAFILVRIVRNVLSGHGPVFNITERVEAYTSPLWLGILSVLGAVRLPIEYTAVFLGLFCTLAGVYLGQRSAPRLFENIDTAGALRLPLGALVFASIPDRLGFRHFGAGNRTHFLLVGMLFLAARSPEASWLT